MKANNETKVSATGATEIHEARKLTLAENVFLTLKVLGGFGFLGALLWGINLLTSGK
jgi:hypothetical protein